MRIVRYFNITDWKDLCMNIEQYNKFVYRNQSLSNVWDKNCEYDKDEISEEYMMVHMITQRYDIAPCEARWLFHDWLNKMEVA